MWSFELVTRDLTWTLTCDTRPCLVPGKAIFLTDMLFKACVRVKLCFVIHVWCLRCLSYSIYHFMYRCNLLQCLSYDRRSNVVICVLYAISVCKMVLKVKRWRECESARKVVWLPVMDNASDSKHGYVWQIIAHISSFYQLPALWFKFGLWRPLLSFSFWFFCNDFKLYMINKHSILIC